MKWGGPGAQDLARGASEDLSRTLVTGPDSEKGLASVCEQVTQRLHPSRVLGPPRALCPGRVEDCLARWSATFQARREEASAERPRRPDAVRPGLGGRRWAWTPPSLLLVLTIVTGVVDAVSYIALGHVFVANMTGNVVFLGFALAGASGLSAPASLAALAAFLLGALAGGRIVVLHREHRGRHLRSASAIGAALVLLAAVLAAIIGQPVSAGARYALIVPLAIAMGIQNATARRLAVSDLTTTVLTLTLTGSPPTPGSPVDRGAMRGAG